MKERWYLLIIMMMSMLMMNMKTGNNVGDDCDNQDNRDNYSFNIFLCFSLEFASINDIKLAFASAYTTFLTIHNSSVHSQPHSIISNYNYNRQDESSPTLVPPTTTLFPICIPIAASDAVISAF